MLLDRLAVFLNDESMQFSYILDNRRIEIQIDGKDWAPIIISEMSDELYVVSWGEVEYQFKNKEKAYQYVFRLCKYINESLQNV
ncbi:hypothetical protein [Parapedobacter defluvii]|uniref:hypothetical protein n=1 Tax=Parapedobacter defluvii TaxID=2045106 RepID=UPI000FC25293|nr:MAG: hypothetical protein EAS52_20450 [Parapedobacter sp.]